MLGGGKYALVAMREAADDVLGKALVEGYETFQTSVRDFKSTRDF